MKTGKRLKNLIILPMAFLISCFLLVGCQFGETEVVLTSSLTEEQVFRIEEQVCTLSEAKVFLTNYQNIYAFVYNVDLWEHDFGAKSLEEYVKDLTISQMAQIISMDYLAQEKEISLSDEEQKKVKEAAEVYYASLNKDEIRYMNVNLGTIEEMYRKYGLAGKVYAQLTEEVNLEVSDDEARVMQALQIYVTKEDTAALVEEKLKEGGDFSSLASTYNKAGETEVTFGRGKMPEEVEEIAFSMDSGQVSASIPTEDGFYFLKCMNNYNQELTDANKKVIVERRRKEAFDDVYEAFIQNLTSEFNEDLWKEIMVEENDKITTSSFFQVYEEYCKW